MRPAARSSTLRPLAVLLAALLAGPARAAQAPPTPAVPPALLEWVGSWSGSAKLTNEAAEAACVYEGAASPGAVTLEITAAGSELHGTLKLALPPGAGPACPAIEKTTEVRDLVASGSSLTFVGPGKHSWTLGRRSRELLGTVAWKGAGNDEAGALRLSGEVRLAKAGAAHKGRRLRRGGRNHRRQRGRHRRLRPRQQGGQGQGQHSARR